MISTQLTLKTGSESDLASEPQSNTDSETNLQSETSLELETSTDIETFSDSDENKTQETVDSPENDIETVDFNSIVEESDSVSSTDTNNKLESDLFDFELDDNQTTEDKNPDLSAEGSELPSVIKDDGSSIELDNYDLDSEESLDFVVETTSSVEPESSYEEEELGDNISIDLSQQTPDEEEDNSPEDDLQSLLDEIREEAEGSVPTTKATSIFTQDNSTEKELTSSEIKKRTLFTCGEDTQISTTQELNNASYILSNHMLATLLNTIELAKQTDQVKRLKFNGIIIVIDHSVGMIYCDLSIYTDLYASACYETINQELIKVHNLDASEIRLYRKKMKEESEYAHSIESFIWTTSLLTARGRLLKYTEIDKKIGLKYWPNLTRLEQIPHAMQIAAVFYKQPGSLLEVSRWLNIEQRYIFAFYNAAHTLKMIELDPKKTTGSLNFDNAKTVSKNRGFFSRLLKRITS